MAIDNRYIGMMQQSAYGGLYGLLQQGPLNAIVSNPSENIQAQRSDDSEKLLLLLEES